MKQSCISYMNHKTLLVIIAIQFMALLATAKATDSGVILDASGLKAENPYSFQIGPSTDGSQKSVIHWDSTEYRPALTLLLHEKDWSKWKALRIKFYSEDGIGKKFVITLNEPGDNEPEKFTPNYYKHTVKIENNKWNEVIIPFTSFDTARDPSFGHIGAIFFFAGGWEIPEGQDLSLEIAEIELVD